MLTRVRSWASSRRAVRGLKQSLALLSRPQRRRYWWAVAAQLITSFLDLAGVLLLGLVGLIAATAVSGQPLPDQVSRLASAFGLEEAPAVGTSLFLAAIAAVLLLAKTALFAYLAHRIYNFLGRCHADVAGRIEREFSHMPIWFVEGRPSQASSYAIYTGTQAAILGVLGSFAIVVSEATLLVLIGGALVLIDPVITIFATALLGVVAVVSQRRLSRSMSRIGVELGSVQIETVRLIQEQVTSFRELQVLHRQRFVTENIARVISRGAGAMAQGQFISQVPKLVYEATLVVGAAVIAGYLVVTKSPEAAIGSLVLFLAAGSRVVPSLLRATSQAVSMSHSAGQAQPAFILVDEMQSVREGGDAQAHSDDEVGGPVVLVPRVDVAGVTFRYPSSDHPALLDVSLSIEAGSHVAFVGASGAGKSTLADVILGVQKPDQGRVLLGGVPPQDAIARWPGQVAYVPQSVALLDGSFRANVALALPDGEIDDERVWYALELAHLQEFVRAAPEGLDTPVGERGVKLSGGQRQRLGLARGLYSRPSLLVLDEATSALDSETEFLISETVASLAGEVTRVTVAHRLATVRSADQVVYLADGVLVAMGTFDEVRAAVPDFDRQATLLGLE